MRWLVAMDSADPDIAKLARWGAANMTGLERMFWAWIGKDDNPWQVIPQYPYMGYIIDFYDPHLKVAIELDGPVHATQRVEDAEREKVLSEAGNTVVRFTRADMIRLGKKGLYDHLEGVFANVDRPAPPPPPPPPPPREPDPPPPEPQKRDPNATPFD